MSENLEHEFTDNTTENTQASPAQPIAPKEENILAGIVGAFGYVKSAIGKAKKN